MLNPTLTKAELQRIVRSIPAGRDPLVRAYELGLRVIAHFLGRDWLDRQFQAPADAAVLHPLPRSDDDPDQAKHVLQVAGLAEMLLNLQFTGGFDVCLEGLRRGAIADAVTALEAGRLLFACQMQFRYAAGAIALRLADATVVAVDATGKLPAEADADGVCNALADAAGRLTGEGPQFIFLQFPAAWSADRVHLLDEGAARFFATGEERVASVKAYTMTEPGAARDMTFAVKEYENPACRFTRAGGWNVFTTPPQLRWRYLRDL